MDVNIALINGRLALEPDFERLADGTVRGRLLVLVRSERRKRFDVLPVVVPPDIVSGLLETASGGTEISVAGSLMRRCSHDPWEAIGRVELVAEAIRFPDCEESDGSVSRTPRSDGRHQDR